MAWVAWYGLGGLGGLGGLDGLGGLGGLESPCTLCPGGPGLGGTEGGAVQGRGAGRPPQGAGTPGGTFDSPDASPTQEKRVFKGYKDLILTLYPLLYLSRQVAGGLRGLRCLGSHHHGLATGVWWRSRGDQGWMVGQVSSHQGQQGQQ